MYMYLQRKEMCFKTEILIVTCHPLHQNWNVLNLQVHIQKFILSDNLWGVGSMNLQDSKLKI